MGAAKKHGPAAYPGIDVGKSRHSACAIDAEVIARTAMGMPRALGPIAAEDAAARSLRALSSQRERVGGVREGRWPATRPARARSRYPA